MKKQFFSKQVCGLLVAGALAPLGAAQAADELSDRYVNGYLNDPYTNEKAADTQSVMPKDAKAVKTSDAGGAQGPVKDDRAAFAADKGFTAEPRESYTGFAPETQWQDRGAKGPIRETGEMTTKPETKRFEQPPLELYNPPYQPIQ